MGLTRASPLLTTVAQVVARTGVQDLAQLEADAELTIATLLAQIHAAIYDRLQADGEDPDNLTNPTSYEAVEAWWLIADLTLGGYLAGDLLARRQKVEDLWRGVRPTYAAAETGPRTGVGAVSVGNMDAEPLLGGPDGGRARRTRFDGSLPVRW